MLMGHAASEKEIEDYKKEIKKDPRQFIAQPIISLSSAPCYINGKVQPRSRDCALPRYTDAALSG
jgi:uncharacterized circularly permuted ATP-grasp superfamily protein